MTPQLRTCSRCSILLPVAGRARGRAHPRASPSRSQKLVGLGVTLAAFVALAAARRGLQADVASYQFEEQRAWIPSYGISYHVGIDGLSLWLVILTTFLTPLVPARLLDQIDDARARVRACSCCCSRRA